MDLRLQGKRAIVTGASVGIGRAIAQGLAEEGADVAINARGADRLADAAKAIAEATGRRIIPIAGDAAVRAETERFVEGAAEALGGIDIVVNSAGLSRFGPFMKHEDEDWFHAIEMKYISHIRTIRAAIPHLRRAGGGVIIEIIGTGGKTYLNGHLAGGAANAALMLLTVGLAAELGPDRIRVVGINPGPVLTERYYGLVRGTAAIVGATEEQVNQKFIDDTPTGSIPTAEEVADLAVYLASDRAHQVNGTIVTIDGGASRAL